MALWSPCLSLRATLICVDNSVGLCCCGRMDLDLTNEEHRDALDKACGVLLLPGMPRDAATQLAQKTNRKHPLYLAFVALSSPESVASVVRALLDTRRVDVVEHGTCGGIDGSWPYVSTGSVEDATYWAFSMKRAASLIIALLASATADEAVRALRSHT